MTSYIPTTGATASRSADIVSLAMNNTNFPGLTGTPGTLWFDIQLPPGEPLKMEP